MNATQQICENCSHVGLETFIDRPAVFHRLLRCPECDLYQKGMNPPAYIYEEAYHVKYTRREASKIATAKLRLAAAKPELPFSRPHLLDIGCSIGATINAAEQLGWKATGVDISRAAVEHCRKQGWDCHTTEGLELPFENETFDVVTHWHVLEHVENVAETLSEWRRVLKPGGLMILETPDARYLKARILGPRYKKFWPSAHLYAFNRVNLSSILNQQGFEILPTRLTGGLTALPPQLNAYALCYRGYREICRSLNLCKSLEISCRKTAA
jgi:ubiquinone/menaquinone biosynthesis C-methylase UbiE